MPNRYKDNSENNNFPNNDHHQRHIPNTDNESTCMFSANSDNTDTAEFRKLLYNDQPNRNNENYGSAPRHPQDPYNNRFGQQNYSHNNQQQYGNQQYSGYPQQQYNQPRQQRYNAQYVNQNPQRQPNGANYNPNYNYNAGAPNSRRPQNSPGGRPPQNRNPQQYNNPMPNRRNTPPPVKTKRKKHHPIRKIIFRIVGILLILFLILFGIYSCTAISLINKMNYVESGARSHVAGALSESYVTNVLLIGTDGRSVDDRGRSDTIIMVSLNSKTDTINLTSFMRDCYVDIPGYGSDKLNHSYAYGGPELLMDTIEKNFNVRIEDYVMINFNSFASIIDAVGGIDLEISDSEAQEINTILMAEVNELMGDPVDSDLLAAGGKVHLNGKQALSYARIRHVGNADFERTQRQRSVITNVIGKLKSFSPSMISNIMDNAIPQVSTNMSTSSLYWLSLRLPFVLGYDFKQIQIPADGTFWSTTTSSGGDALGFDFDANYSIIKDQVFGK